jgi:hypothetical protein
LFETGATPAPIPEATDPGWLAGARDALVRGGDYLAFEDGGARMVALDDGWTRIGRSLAAHVRFDDPTVSRRHALIYRDDEGAKALDDRSLNGLFHNGERVELADLSDGDVVGGPLQPALRAVHDRTCRTVRGGHHTLMGGRRGSPQPRGTRSRPGPVSWREPDGVRTKICQL